MLLYANAPDLDQLSALEVQLKQEKGMNNKFKNQPKILTSKIDSLTKIEITRNNSNKF